MEGWLHTPVDFMVHMIFEHECTSPYDVERSTDHVPGPQAACRVNAICMRVFLQPSDTCRWQCLSQSSQLAYNQAA